MHKVLPAAVPLRVSQLLSYVCAGNASFSGDVLVLFRNVLLAHMPFIVLISKKNKKLMRHENPLDICTPRADFRTPFLLA